MGAAKVEATEPSATMPQDTIPLEFIQPAPVIPHGASLIDVPVINFDDPDEETLVRLVMEASRDWGLFQIVNHEIPSDAIEKLQEVGKVFFELPQEEKGKYAKPADSKSMEGYGTKLRKDGVQGWVDYLFHVIWPTSARKYQFWPENPSTYREATEEYTTRLHGVVNKLLKTLSLGLGLEGHELKEAVGGEELVYLLKINHYPPCPRPDLALGVPPHTDMSAFTILVPNDVQGLQVFRDGHWYDVEYIPNALIIHIGDQLEVVSNGKYKAVLHRTTVSKEKTRYSWPVFLEPPEDKEIGPHTRLVTEENPAKYKTKTYGEYGYRKFNKLPQ